VDLCATAILPLLLAAQEAWMSITPFYLTVARLRIWMNVNSLVWAVAGDWEALDHSHGEGT
jgi:hypothetical protein